MAVVLQPGARLKGVVRTLGGPHPFPDARVTLIDTAGNVLGTATTGPDGAHAFTDLDTGAYSVVASGYPPAARSVNVLSSRVETAEVDLAHPET